MQTPPQTDQSWQRNKTRIIAISAMVLGMVAGTVIILADRYWPFTESAIREDLASATSTQVEFGKFRKKYFPPGCVAENVIFDRGSASIIQIRRLTITSGLSGLLRHHVSMFRAEGARINFEAGALKENKLRNKIVIDNFVADDAVLEIAKRSQPPLRFVFHNFAMKNLSGDGATHFTAVFENPLPRGLLRTSGQFGPWRNGDPGSTPATGTYELQQADLSVFKSIAGTLSSSGRFEGTFKELGLTGSTHSPEFVIAKTRHAQPLDTEFEATVNAFNGDVTLRSVNAHFGRDVVSGAGSIARRENGKRSALLGLRCDRGRVEDTFYPFIHSSRSPLVGDIEFQMHVVIPSGHQPFLQKLQLSSTFKIQNAKFTNPPTEVRISRVSSPPDQEDSETLADFQGSVILRNGTAQFSSLSVHDQDAQASLRGTFNLINQKVDMYGHLKTAASLGKTTHGIKAVFAKVIEPFFKKKPHETVIPVHVGGTYSHPSFGLDIGG